MSKLINQSRLQQFATGLWTKIKTRYDDAFIDAEIPTGEKKIKFTKRKNGETKDVSLEEYARLQDRNKFEQDVSVDNVAIESNAHIKNRLTNNSSNRLLGYRGLTSKNFVDGHISTLRVLVDSDLENDTATRWKLWAIKKDNTSRNNDTVKKAYGELTRNVKTVTINGETHKAIDFEINQEFTDEVYFVVKSTGSKFRITYPNDPYKADVVNMSAEPSGTVGDRVNWDTNADGENTAIMYLYGRESIKSLSEKLDKVQSDGSLYVKVADTTDGTGTEAKNGKVLKLDNNGKINKDVLPAIALNEFFSVTTFSESGLANVQYQNGDIIFDSTNQKRYLCINVSANTFNEKFVELNAKDGVVTSVNNLRGDISLALAHETEKIKLNITSGNAVETLELPVITEGEINTIIQNLS